MAARPVESAPDAHAARAARRHPEHLADELGQRIKHEVRATVLGHTQRGGTPTPFDRVLATRLGCAAAWLVGQGDWGKMVAVRGSEIVPVLDCGGAIKGYRLDVIFPTHEQARAWGVRRLNVTVWEFVDGSPRVNPRRER